MHHVTLYGTWSHDRHFDDQVVIATRLQARQHGHLRARFDLKYADSVGTADHLVNARILGRHIGQGERWLTIKACNKPEAAADRGQHA